ncbi:hypothetical protein [Streptomyces sp. NBC_00038]|uniref:hypothetical protein n=1 Tax=Streptomyces sp. NBC_00038 TaxID=2903615 RepID=UPI0022549C8C|nr:hypothetical protein [Streptomyces sp. NBC_00038]MCX5554647.1 hypothetical protein [Streptomyces sp. NBC_00038]
MGTTLTPEFWERFTVLLLAAALVTFALSAALDALVVRIQLRRVRKAEAPAHARTAPPRSRTRPPLVHHRHPAAASSARGRSDLFKGPAACARRQRTPGS